MSWLSTIVMDNLHLLLSTLDGDSLLLLELMLSIGWGAVESVVDLVAQVFLGGLSADSLLLADLLHLWNVTSQLLHSLFSLSEALLDSSLEIGVDLFLELIGLYSFKWLSLINEGKSALLSGLLAVDCVGNGGSSLLLCSLQFLGNLFKGDVGSMSGFLGFLLKSLLDLWGCVGGGRFQVNVESNGVSGLFLL